MSTSDKRIEADCHLGTLELWAGIQFLEESSLLCCSTTKTATVQRTCTGDTRTGYHKFRVGLLQTSYKYYRIQWQTICESAKLQAQNCYLTDPDNCSAGVVIRRCVYPYHFAVATQWSAHNNFRSRQAHLTQNPRANLTHRFRQTTHLRLSIMVGPS